MKRACLLSLIALAVPAAAQADTTTVDPAASGSCARGGSCTTIAAAVGVAQASDTIHVKAGSYTGAVSIPSALNHLTINGEGGAFLGGTLSIAATNVTVTGLGIINTAGSDPAVSSSADGLTLADSTVASTVGTALDVTGGAGNRVQRSTVLSTLAAGKGIALAPGDLTVDSSIVLGGTSGAAYAVATTSNSDNASLTLNHVTTTGAHALLLDATGGSLGLAPGSITLKVTSSIIHGVSALAANAGLPLTGIGASTVTATFDHSDVTQVNGTDGNPIAGTGNPTADSLLFRNSKLRLKGSAPVIDKGAPAVAGESPQDIDGDPRTVNSVTDIGADEYLDHAPTLSFAVSPSSPKTGDTVTVTGHATDPDGNDDVIGYEVDWGDGTKKNQTASNVIQHVYGKPGTYTITMAAGDTGGLISNFATQPVTLADGLPPQLKLTTPADGGSAKVGKKQLSIKGVDADDSGLSKVEVALTKVGSSCKQYTGAKLKSAGCSKYTFLTATLHGTGFKLVTKKGLHLPKGTYEARVRGTDSKGNATSGFDKNDGTLVRFKLK